MTAQGARLRTTLGHYVAGRAQALANAILQILRETTPVDTGAARRGWHIIPTANGLAVVNPEAHIIFLNLGSSSQAPTGFVESAQIQAISLVRAQSGGRSIKVTDVSVLGADAAGNLAVAYNPRRAR